jgi:hypothetical protein
MDFNDLDEDPKPMCVTFGVDNLDDRRKRGGCCSTKGSCGSGMIHPTSTGTRSGWTVHAAARNSDRSNESMVHGATSKMRHDEPTTYCTVCRD